MSKSLFSVAERIFPRSSRAWFVLETIQTSDGPRTRVCGAWFATEGEALAEMKKREGNG